MRFGVTFPSLDPRTLADLAREAEGSGWDGVFVWDLVYGYDAWVSLAAVAAATARIRFGTMLTPLSRRKPWKVASEVVTLDHLSNGRVILPIGLGAAGPEHPGSQFGKVGEETDRRVRAERLDECLDILDGLWSGQPFSYEGEHFHLRDVTFSPMSVQRPRVPIWVVGAWPRPKSMRRVVRCDGVLPVQMGADRIQSTMTPDSIREMRTWIAGERAESAGAGGSFDIVMEGETPGDDREQAVSVVRPLADAGVTWWLENVWATPETVGGVEGMRERVRQGPPAI